MTETDVPHDGLGQLVPLAKGGTAAIYRVPDIDRGVGPLVYKKYKDKFRRHAGEAALTAGLRRFVRFREKLAPGQRTLWDQRIVWPIAVVIDDDGQATGMLMPLIPDRFFHDFPKTAGGTASSPLDIETLFGAPGDPPAKYLPPVSVTDRLALVTAIAHAYGLMHRVDVILGDVSGRNVVYTLQTTPPSVLVVDVDGVRLQGNRATAGSQAHTPNWEPPEALSAERRVNHLRRAGGTPDDVRRYTNAWSIQTKQTDAYKFGLMVTRLLDPGRGKTSNRDPARAVQVLQAHRLDVAADLLSSSLSADAAERPSMREWYQALGGNRTGCERRGDAAWNPASGIAEGTRKGDWVWAEGTGWVKSPARRQR